MRHVQLIALGLAFTLVGCQLPLNLPQAMTPIGQSPNGSTPSVTPADNQAPRMGTLSFAIRWPERSLPGFTAQVIPLSTEKLVFTLSNPTIEGFEPITREFIRKAGEDLITTTLHLPHGGGYKARVTAYDKDGVPIADNTAANVNNVNTLITVTWGKVTPIPITLDALFAPKITDLGVGHGTPGQTLTITGENFARGETAPIVIFPAGIEAAGKREADGTITAVIPTGAGSGQLRVKVDGVTSTSMAMFQDVRTLELSAEGAEQGGMRDGDGAIASWLGDFFPITVVGKDEAHVLVPNPALTGWNNPADGIGTIAPNGTFTAQMLGRSSVTAQLGTVSGSRDVIVAPPAGPIIRPADNVKDIADLSLTRVGDRYLAAWFVPGTEDNNTIYWQLRNADGTPAPGAQVYSENVAWDGFERAFRVSAAPDANGQTHEILLAYRLSLTASNDPNAKRNAVVFRALDPLTGAFKGSRYDINGTNLEADRLLDVTSGESGHLIGTLRFDGSKYKHRFVKAVFDPTTGALASNLAISYQNDEFVPYSYREDSVSLTASGSHFVIARHTGSGGGSGPTAMSLQVFDSNLDTVRSSSVLHEQNRVAAVATHGDTTVVAAMELSAGGTALKLYRYDANLKSIGLGTTIADLNIAGSDPLNWPLDLEWSKSSDPADPGRFLLTYARKVGTFVNGQLVYYPQAMIQALKPDGTLDGPAYPLAKDSQMPALSPSAEGGMALWLDSSRSLIMRRVKFR